MINYRFIYSIIIIVLISTCCFEFNHYKTWSCSITVFYNTLKLNHIILYHIWYLLHDEPIVLYIFQNTPSIDFKMLYWISSLLDVNFTIRVFYNTIKLNHIILYHIWYLQNDKLSFYIYSRILPVLISKCCINLITTNREFTVSQYSTELSCIIISFCVIFDICYMMNLSFHIYSSILPVLISTCCIEFNHYKTRIYCITVSYCTLKRNHIILYHIWYLLHDEPIVLYIFQNTPSIDFKMLYWISSLLDVNFYY